MASLLEDLTAALKRAFVSAEPASTSEPPPVPPVAKPHHCLYLKSPGGHRVAFPLWSMICLCGLSESVEPRNLVATWQQF